MFKWMLADGVFGCSCGEIRVVDGWVGEWVGVGRRVCKWRE